ncbi:Origin recognition complex subunit 4 [Cytospora mali]|uniref:Origin recognition complex subunit 4 n=1 Tax=Cytospora mali TaxID=578113 RepID=A0A194WAM8_CYTMA|nr:Origin recognition complex subunit 4 [Valsa mali]
MAGEAPKRRGRPPKQPKEGDEQQQTPQPAKSRGRPPKPKPAEDAVQPGSAATPKRGRGRPPKAKNEGGKTAAAAVSTGKSKGTKAGATKATTATTTAPRPRGRPRKSDASEAVKSIQTAKAPVKVSSIVGGYIITCEAISKGWPDEGDDLGLDISESATPGVYEGSFRFGILEGAMVFSSDEALLKSYVKMLEANELEANGLDESSDEDDEGEDEDEDEPTITGGKRKATSTARGGTAKKARKDPSPGLKFHILWRGRETGEGQIHPEPEQGTIKFSNKSYTKFTGEIDLPYVGDGVKFTGEKVTEQANTGSTSWDEFSEVAYERARIGRWR